VLHADPDPLFGKDPNFWGMNIGVFTILKLAYYDSYSIDYDQILYSDKDHQMPVVGGAKTLITNPRWRTAATLEKSKNRHISATV